MFVNLLFVCGIFMEYGRLRSTRTNNLNVAMWWWDQSCGSGLVDDDGEGNERLRQQLILGK